MRVAMNHVAPLERSLDAIFKQEHPSGRLSDERIAERRRASGRGPGDCSYGTRLSSAFPQVTVALISFLETMLITYLSYKVGKWSAGPHFLCSIYCTFSLPSDGLIYLTPVAKRIPASVHQRTPKGFRFRFLSRVFLSVVINSISQRSIQTEEAYFKYIEIIRHLSVTLLSWFLVVGNQVWSL